MLRPALLLSFLSLVLLPAPSGAQRTNASSDAIVYVTAIDEHDAPVTDLADADLIVKEDGKPRKVLSVGAATGPLQVVVLVDDDGSGIFRFGLSGFAEVLQGRAEISLRVVTGQVHTIFDYTTDARAWMRGIAQVGVRPATPEGGQLLEGISEASKDLKKREAPRPAIVALTVGGEEQSSLLARNVLDQLHQSRAVLHVIFAESPAIRPVGATSKPADLLEGNFNLSRVLGDGPKESGGRRRDVLATQAVLRGIQQIARELAAQYAVTYVRPPEKNSPQKIEVSARRRGVKVFAPTRAPLG